mgnify:CR=1 FL=1
MLTIKITEARVSIIHELFRLEKGDKVIMTTEKQVKKQRKGSSREQFRRLDCVMRNIGDVYIQAKRRVDILQFEGYTPAKEQVMNDDARLVYLIDRTVQDCTDRSGCIIRNEYLQRSEKTWHRAFFPRSTYMRSKREALREFLSLLGIQLD